MRMQCLPPAHLLAHAPTFCSPPPASEASGGEGLGVGGAACSDLIESRSSPHQRMSKRRPPTPRAAASLRRSTLPANGREGEDRTSVPSKRLKSLTIQPTLTVGHPIGHKHSRGA